MFRIIKLKNKCLIGVLGLILSFSSCNNYLDIVPDDGIATLETAFNLRTTAIRYLYTCYGFLTSEGNLDAAMDL
jgi:hypothetical protein